MKTKRLISNKQQWLVDREFVELVHEIAFGDSAIDKDYSNEEVLVRLNEFAHESNKLEAIQECCRFETDDPDAELMRTDTKGFADKMAGQGMSDIEIGVHLGLLEKADRIMAIIKREGEVT